MFWLRIAPPSYLAGWGGKTRRIMCRVIRVGYGRARCVRGMPRRLTVEQSYFIYEAGGLMTAMKLSPVRLTKMLAQIFYLGMVRRLYDERGIHQRLMIQFRLVQLYSLGLWRRGTRLQCTLHNTLLPTSIHRPPQAEVVEFLSRASMYMHTLFQRKDARLIHVQHFLKGAVTWSLAVPSRDDEGGVRGASSRAILFQGVRRTVYV